MWVERSFLLTVFLLRKDLTERSFWGKEWASACVVYNFFLRKILDGLSQANANITAFGKKRRAEQLPWFIFCFEFENTWAVNEKWEIKSTWKIRLNIFLKSFWSSWLHGPLFFFHLRSKGFLELVGLSVWYFQGKKTDLRLKNWRSLQTSCSLNSFFLSACQSVWVHKGRIQLFFH